MHETSTSGVANFIEKTQLIKLKKKAMRTGVWFRNLPRIDRVLVELTIKVTSSIRSPYLARCILAITGKLENLFENRLNRAVREIGLPIAQKLSLLAQKWGCKTANFWLADDSYARYWAAMKLNIH